jgi:hypothetical protein
MTSTTPLWWVLVVGLLFIAAAVVGTTVGLMDGASGSIGASQLLSAFGSR